MSVLVAYADAAAEMAKAMAKGLVRRGIDAVAVSADAVETIEPYDAVVLVGEGYAGRWSKPIKKLLEAQTSALSELPVWCLGSGFTELDKEKLGFAERGVVRAVHPPQGDFCDWLDAFSAQIARELKVHRPAARSGPAGTLAVE